MITMHALHIFMRASRASLLTLIAASLMLGCTVWFGTRPALEQAQARADESGRLLARASQRDAVTRERDRARERATMLGIPLAKRPSALLPRRFDIEEDSLKYFTSNVRGRINL